MPFESFGSELICVAGSGNRFFSTPSGNKRRHYNKISASPYSKKFTWWCNPRIWTAIHKQQSTQPQVVSVRNQGIKGSTEEWTTVLRTIPISIFATSWSDLCDCVGFRTSVAALGFNSPFHRCARSGDPADKPEGLSFGISEHKADS